VTRWRWLPRYASSRGIRALPLPPEPALVSQSHLMIANPFSVQSGLTTLFSTHPAMADRIRCLEEMASYHPAVHPWAMV
jgi:heat shock protein HtpX